MANLDTYGKMFHSRAMDQRSRIVFHYGGDPEPLIFLPFYENPTITETQSANYAEYNPIGRAGSLYAYTGASSRKIKVKMHFTLPHLAMHEMGINRFTRIFANSGKESDKLLFTQNAKFSSMQKKGDAANSLSKAVEKVYLSILAESEGSFLNNAQLSTLYGNQATQAVLNSVLGPLGANVDLPESAVTETHKVIDTLLFFIALLRTSVTNKATNPMYGPPLLRLDFGTLYQSVPCICKSYNLSWEDEAGYHLETLTPRRLTVALTLEEVRVGDFGQYEPAKFVKGDNLTGWESAINSPYTTDPLPVQGFWSEG